MGLLMLIGLIVIYSIGPQRANVLNNLFGSDLSDTYFFIKQLSSLAVALVIFVVMTVLPYEKVLKWGGRLLAAGLIACGILAFADWTNLPIAQESLGATRWFTLGPIGTLQPAEILKFGLLVYIAGFLGIKAKEGKVNDVQGTLIPIGVMVAISMLFVIVIQEDLGTGITLALIVLSMLFVSGLTRKNLTMILIGALVLGALMIVIAPHRIDRIATFLKGDSSSTSDAGSYHIEHAKIALGTGGLIGVGIGDSVQATGYLPESINDSIFAIIGETFGFVGLMVLLGIFVALLMRLLQVMDHLVDYRLKLLVAGVFGWFGAHVVVNIAAMIGIFPLTGITLPLLSFGGTSMVFIAAALGLVFQLSRYTVHGSRLKEATNENSRSRRGLGRARYASRSSS